MKRIIFWIKIYLVYLYPDLQIIFTIITEHELALNSYIKKRLRIADFMWSKNNRRFQGFRFHTLFCLKVEGIYGKIALESLFRNHKILLWITIWYGKFRTGIELSLVTKVHSPLEKLTISSCFLLTCKGNKGWIEAQKSPQFGIT